MDARLREGIRLFNAREFFASHEVLEDLYLHTSEVSDKPFLEGMIELAVAFRLYRDFGEVQGPVRMIHQALIRFEPYQPTYLRVRVDKLSRALDDWTQRAKSSGDKHDVLRDRIPKIQTKLGLF